MPCAEMDAFGFFDDGVLKAGKAKFAAAANW
jgi:hypothetical protein